MIGDRQTDQISHFSPIKKVFIVGLEPGAATVGHRRADIAQRVSRHEPQGRAGLVRAQSLHLQRSKPCSGRRAGITLENVKIRTNEAARVAAVKSIPDYLKKAGGVISAPTLYRPVQVFSRIALGCSWWAPDLARFLSTVLGTGPASGHVAVVLSETGAWRCRSSSPWSPCWPSARRNRRLLEDLLVRLRSIESHNRATPQAATSRRLDTAARRGSRVRTQCADPLKRPVVAVEPALHRA